MRPRRARWRKRCRRPWRLAGEGWTQRLGSGPRGPGEVFLAAAYAHVRARSQDEAFYSLEAEPQPLSQDLLTAVRNPGARPQAHCRAAGAAGAPAAQEDGRQERQPGALHARAAGSGGAGPGPPRQGHPARLDRRCWRPWRMAKCRTNSSTGSRSRARTAAMSMSGWSGTGSIPPFRWRRRCWRRRMAR